MDASTAVRQDDLEVTIVHEEARAYAKSAAIPGLLCLGLALDPSRSSRDKSSSFLTACLCFTCIVVTIISVRETNRESLLARAYHVGNFGHLIRTLIHCLWIYTGSDSIFYMCLTLFILPLSSARQSHNFRSFVGYIFLHSCLTFFRFKDALAVKMPWIVATIISNAVLLDVAIQRDLARNARIALEASKAKIAQMAELNAKSFFDSFCDAHVVLDSSLNLLETSKSLEVITGRQALQGKSFMDFIDLSDREEFRHFIDTSAQDLDLNAEGKLSPDQLHSVRVHLSSLFSVPIPVHLLSIRAPNSNMESLMIGICEVWQPKKTKKESSRRSEKAKLNMETGKLEPANALFPEKLDNPKFPLADLLQGAQSPSGLQERSSRDRRQDSPRPTS